MANRIPSRPRWTTRPRTVAGTLALLLALGACETTDQIVDTVNPVNWFKDESAAADGAESPIPATADTGAYPRVGPVEPVPPTPAIAGEAAALRSALVADKENARYTDQVLRAQSEPAAREQQAAQARAQALSPTAPSPAAIPQASPSTAQVAASGATITPPPPRPAGAPTPVPVPVPVPVAQGASGAPTPQPTPVAVPTPAQAPAPAPAQAARPAPAPEPLPAARPSPAPAPTPTPIQTQTASLDRPTPPPAAPGVASAAPAGAAQPTPQPAPAIQPRLIAYIYFGDGGAALSDSDRDVIRQVMEIYRSSGGKGVALVGHSSGRTGSEDALQGNLVNFKLSLDRATAVGNAFVAQGLDRDLVRIDARGASEPKFTEDSPTGEAGNRRVDVYILY